MNVKRIAATVGCTAALGCGWAPAALAAVYPPDTTTPATVISAVSPAVPTESAAPSTDAVAAEAGALPTTGSSSTGIGLQIGAGAVAAGLVGMVLSRRRVA